MKGLFLILSTVVILAVMGYAAVYHDIRANGASGHAWDTNTYNFQLDVMLGGTR